MTLSESRVSHGGVADAAGALVPDPVDVVSPPLRLLSSGWIPALLVASSAVATLRDAGNVAARDLLAYAAWLGWSATVPGVLAWRAVDWRGRPAPGADPRDRATGRPFLEDVVLGTILGVIVSIPAYLAAVALGHPLLVLGWPLLVLVPLVLTTRGRSILLRRQAEPTPAWWSWTLAALVLYVVAFSAETRWLVEPLTPASLRSPYVDEPYHLALIAEFRHHFPPEVPFVAGTPLRYHWLVYPFAAAGSWAAASRPSSCSAFVTPVSAECAAGPGRGRGGVPPERPPLGRARQRGRPLRRVPWTCWRWTRRRSPGWPPAGSRTTRRRSRWPTPCARCSSWCSRACCAALARRPQHWVLAFVVMLAVAGRSRPCFPCSSPASPARRW